MSSNTKLKVLRFVMLDHSYKKSVQRDVNPFRVPDPLTEVSERKFAQKFLWR